MDSHACHFKWQVILVKQIWIRLRCTSLIVSVYQSLYWIYTLLVYFRALLDIAKVLGICYLYASLWGSLFDDNGKDVGLITNLCFWTQPHFSPPLSLAFDPHDFQAVTQENQHQILFNFTSETTVYGTTEVSSHWLRHTTSIENLPWQALHKMQDCLENKI